MHMFCINSKLYMVVWVMMCVGLCVRCDMSRYEWTVKTYMHESERYTGTVTTSSVINLHHNAYLLVYFPLFSVTICMIYIIDGTCCIWNSKHTCQPVRLRILEILFFWTLRSHSSKPLPSTAMIRSYLSSAHQHLTGEPQENIRKPIIVILNLNYST